MLVEAIGSTVGIKIVPRRWLIVCVAVVCDIFPLGIPPCGLDRVVSVRTPSLLRCANSLLRCGEVMLAGAWLGRCV